MRYGTFSSYSCSFDFSQSISGNFNYTLPPVGSNLSFVNYNNSALNCLRIIHAYKEIQKTIERRNALAVYNDIRLNRLKQISIVLTYFDTAYGVVMPVILRRFPKYRFFSQYFSLHLFLFQSSLKYYIQKLESAKSEK